MTYHQAKAHITQKRLVGVALIVIGFVMTVIGFLKGMYVSLPDDGGLFFPNLPLALKRLIYAIYEKTQFLSFVWEHASSPNLKDPFTLGNLWCLFWYLCIFFGVAILRSANRLAARLGNIQRQIEDEAIRGSIQGTAQRTRAQIEESVEIPKQPIWKDIHTLYIAPIITGLILLVLGKLLGLV